MSLNAEKTINKVRDINDSMRRFIPDFDEPWQENDQRYMKELDKTAWQRLDNVQRAMYATGSPGPIHGCSPSGHVVIFYTVSENSLVKKIEFQGKQTFTIDISRPATDVLEGNRFIKIGPVEILCYQFILVITDPFCRFLTLGVGHFGRFIYIACCALIIRMRTGSSDLSEAFLLFWSHRPLERRSMLATWALISDKYGRKTCNFSDQIRFEHVYDFCTLIGKIGYRQWGKRVTGINKAAFRAENITFKTKGDAGVRVLAFDMDLLYSKLTMMKEICFGWPLVSSLPEYAGACNSRHHIRETTLTIFELDTILHGERHEENDPEEVSSSSEDSDSSMLELEMQPMVRTSHVGPLPVSDSQICHADP